MATNPVKQLQALLLWARKEKIALSQVQLGSLCVVVDRDYALTLPTSAPVVAGESRMNILEQHAGALLGALRGEAVAADTVETNEPTEEDE